MRLLLFLTADYTNVTSDGKLNIMGIFNQINASSFPSCHPSMYLVIKLAVDLKEESLDTMLNIKLRDQENKEIFGITIPIAPQDRHTGKPSEIQVILQLKDIIFPHPGKYQFVLLVENEHQAALQLDVTKIETPSLEL